MLAGLKASHPGPLKRPTSRPRIALLALAAATLVSLVAAVRADAYVYWGTGKNGATTIGRATLNGSSPNPGFIPVAFIGGFASAPCGVAVDGGHVYWANQGSTTIGRANLDGSGADQSFISTAGAGSPCGVAVSAFSFGEVNKNRKRGTAKLTVIVSAPGELELARTKKVKGKDKRVTAEGKVKLPVKPKRKAKKKLKRKGKAKVKAKVTFTPDGGEAITQSEKVGLKKR